MRQTLREVQDGSWAAGFIADQDAGAPEFARLRKEGEQHPIEATGRELRKLMSWVKSDDDYTEEPLLADGHVRSRTPRSHTRTGR